MALLRQGATRSNALLGSGRDAWRLQHDRASCHSRRAFASSSPAATSTTQERAALAASSPLVPKPSYFTHEQHKTPHSRTAGTYAHAWSMLLGASVFGCSALLAANAMPSAARTEAPPNGDKSAVNTQPAITSVPVRLEKLVPTLSSDPSVRRRRSAGRDRLLISTAAVRGDRSRMEDTSFVSDCKRFNAVFDGHGGAAVSTYIQKHLFPLIAPGLAQLDQEASSPEGKENDHVYKKLHDLIQRAVEKIDADVLARPEWKFQGTTATGVMLYDEAIVSFNVGDSRAVLSRGGQTVELTRDHKPNDPIEMARIQKLGGTVKWYGYVDAQGDPIEPYGAYRVNGNLAVGRAIGDRDSRPYVTGEVEIKHFDRDFDKDEFIVIASDGLWDVFTSEEAVTFVHDVLSGELGGRESWRSGGHSDTSVPIFEWSQQYKSDRGMIKAARARRKVQIANYLVQEALFRGTSDNVSVIVVWLK